MPRIIHVMSDERKALIVRRATVRRALARVNDELLLLQARRDRLHAELDSAVCGPVLPQTPKQIARSARMLDALVAAMNELNDGGPLNVAQYDSAAD